VLGNSGSLLDLPPQEQWHPDALVIGVNRILRKGLCSRRYRPHALVISDGRVAESEAELLKPYEGVLMMCRWINTDIPHWIFDSYCSKRKHYRQDIKQFPTEVQQRLWHINNVSFHAAQLACCLLAPGGTIYLAGCELTWPEDGRPHHFYSTAVLPPTLRPFRLNKKLMRQWGSLSRWCTSQGKQLLDCSPWRDVAIPELEQGQLPQ
jgi:hypothetical protein